MELVKQTNREGQGLMERVWYYRSNGQKEGPYTESELIKLIVAGIIGPEDEIWMLRLHYWFKIKDTVLCYYLP